MLAIPLDGTTLLIVVVLVALALLLAIFAPQAMSNILGEPFALFGRLLGTIADWLQKGADKLFALVKSVFLIGHPVVKESATANTTPDVQHIRLQRRRRTTRRQFGNIPRQMMVWHPVAA